MTDSAEKKSVGQVIECIKWMRDKLRRSLILICTEEQARIVDEALRRYSEEIAAQAPKEGV